MASVFALADIFSEDDTEYEAKDAILQLDGIVGGKVGTVLSRGVPGLFGITMANLFGERANLATDLYAESQRKDALGRIADIMFGAPYGYGTDAVKSAITTKNWIMDAIENNGALTNEYKTQALKNISKVAPLALRNLIMGGIIFPERGVEASGDVLIKPEDMSWHEFVAKMAGFQPIKYKRLTGRIRELTKMRGRIAKDKHYSRSEKKSELGVIADLLREAHKEKAQFLQQIEIRQAIREGKLKL